MGNLVLQYNSFTQTLENEANTITTLNSPLLQYDSIYIYSKYDSILNISINLLILRDIMARPVFDPSDRQKRIEEVDDAQEGPAEGVAADFELLVSPFGCLLGRDGEVLVLELFGFRNISFGLF